MPQTALKTYEFFEIFLFEYFLVKYPPRDWGETNVSLL